MRAFGTHVIALPFLSTVVFEDDSRCVLDGVQTVQMDRMDLHPRQGQRPGAPRRCSPASRMRRPRRPADYLDGRGRKRLQIRIHPKRLRTAARLRRNSQKHFPVLIFFLLLRRTLRTRLPHCSLNIWGVRCSRVFWWCY